MKQPAEARGLLIFWADSVLVYLMKILILFFGFVLSASAFANTLCEGKISIVLPDNSNGYTSDATFDINMSLADLGKVDGMNFVLTYGLATLYYGGDIDPTGVQKQMIVDAHADVALSFQLKVLSESSVLFQGQFMSDSSPSAYVKRQILPAVLNCH